MSNITIVDLDQQNKDSITFNAIGVNNILVIASKNTTENINPENTTWCSINKQFIIKFDELSYTDNYLNLMFDHQSETNPTIASDKYLIQSTNDYVLRPNIMLFYINREIINKIIDYKEKKINNIPEIYDLVYQLIIRPDYPDNYRQLRKLWLRYKKTKNNNLKRELHERLRRQKYSNIFNLDKDDLNKLKSIYRGIVIFFSSFGIKEREIIINVSMFNLKNRWIDINIEFRRIYEGDYKYIRLTQKHKTISLLEVIDELEKYGNLLGLENKYQTSMRLTDVHKYNLDNFCIKSKQPVERTMKIKHMNLNYDSKKLTPYNYGNIIINNRFNPNIKINRVLRQKNSKVSSLCSASICINFKDDYYVLNIIPRTYVFLSNLVDQINKKDNIIIINNKHNITNILDYLYSNTREITKSIKIMKRPDFVKSSKKDNIYFETIKQTNIQLDYYKHYNLRYLVELIRINPYDCYGCIIENKLCNKLLGDNLFIDEIARYNTQIIYVPVKENHEIAEILIKNYKSNFYQPSFVIYYNLVRSIILYYRKTNDLNGAIGLIEKLIELDNKSDHIPFEYLVSDYKDIKFYQNKSKVFILDKDQPFICVYGDSYVYNILDLTQFKLLTWYCFYNQTDFNEINSVIDRMIDNNIKCGMQMINLDIFKRIYNYNDQQAKNIVENYLYNICSLVNKNIKNKLDNFLSKVRTDFIPENNSYDYTFFHYPTGRDTTTLHLHTLLKISTHVTRGSVSWGNYYAVGKSNFSIEVINKLAHSYDNFEIDRWRDEHIYYIRIENIKKFIEYYKEYNNLLDTVVNLDKITAPQIIMAGLNKEYLEKLLGYKDNYDTFMDFIKNIK